MNGSNWYALSTLFNFKIWLIQVLKICHEYSDHRFGGTGTYTGLEIKTKYTVQRAFYSPGKCGHSDEAQISRSALPILKH